MPLVVLLRRAPGRLVASRSTPGGAPFVLPSKVREGEPSGDALVDTCWAASRGNANYIELSNAYLRSGLEGKSRGEAAAKTFDIAYVFVIFFIYQRTYRRIA